MFEKELALIKNPFVRKIAEDGVKLIPDYFYHVPASSTGKYHPSYALNDGGLYRHVQAAVSIANMLFTIHDFTPDEKDVIIASIILHDGWKQGETLSGGEGHTVFAHPVIAKKVLLEKLSETCDAEFLSLIVDNIASHMGQWNTSKFEALVLPRPETPMQKYVHLCDYLASRKPIEYNFSIG